MRVIDNVTLAPRKLRRGPSPDIQSRAIRCSTGWASPTRRPRTPTASRAVNSNRVAIARSLAIEPEVMLLDEITSALDPELVGEVLDVVRDLRQAGMTMVVATQETAFAREITEAVHFLDAGRIVESGPPSQVLGSPIEPRTQEVPGASRQRGTAVTAGGVGPTSLSTSSP